jgi:hypothetical protein
MPELPHISGDGAIKVFKQQENNKDMRLWRRFTQIEKLDTKEKRHGIQLLDSFIEKDLVKQETQMQ